MKLCHGGYTPKVAGRPSRQVDELPLPHVLRIPLRRGETVYRALVDNGRLVGFGEPLAEAKIAGGRLLLPAPCAGRVRTTAADAEHLILEELEPQRPADSFAAHEPSRLGGDRMRQLLAEGGVWPFFWSTSTGGVPPVDGSEQPHAIVVNFVLAEPFRARGRVLLVHSWDRIISGIRFLPRVLSDYGKVEVVLTAVHDPVARRLYAELSGHTWTRLHVVPVTYPIGDPRVLIMALKKSVKSYGREHIIWTIDAQGVEAIGACLGEGLPLASRVVAIGGPGVANPRHVKVRIGTPVDALLPPGVARNAAVLRGGLLKGEPVDPQTASVGYDDDAFFVLPKSSSREMLSFVRAGWNRVSYQPAFASLLTGAPDRHITTSLRGEQRPCIACGNCEQVCPVELMPHVIHRYLYREAYEQAQKAGVESCIDCNLCTFVCPSKIELQKQFADARAHLRAEREEARSAEETKGVAK